MTDADGKQNDQSTFDFEEGDFVVVKVREQWTSGPLLAKFVAKCTEIGTDTVGGRNARFKLPGAMNRVSYSEYEAEFEQVESPTEVNF